MKDKKKKIKLGFGLLATYLIGQAVYMENFSDVAKTTPELIKIVKEEEPKVRKDSLERHIYWTSGKTYWGTAASAKISDKDYIIILDQKKNRSTIRHELYHVYKGHCDKAYKEGEWSTRDKILNEITANLYAYYGLRF